MAPRYRRLIATSAALVLLAALAGGGWAGRRSLRAAWHALLHPEILDGSGARTAGSAERMLESPSDELDERIALEFQELDKLALDDPDSSTLAGLTTTDLPVAITRRTLRFVRFFAFDPIGRKIFRERMRRSGLYRSGIEQQLREAGLPEDLVWVPAVESSFDPQSVSPAGAAGMWQFMPETAALYGLEQSPWLDERRSLTRATEAAVTHLRDLFERLGSWDLSLAAYNMGYDGVLRALQTYVDRHPEQADDAHPPSFVDLARDRLLPAETADYVPKVTALAIVAANLARFDHDDVDRERPLQLSTLAVPEATPLRIVARAAGMALADLKQLNPELLRDRVPVTGGDYLMTLPAERLEHARASLPAYLDNDVLELESTTALPAMPEPLVLGESDGSAPLPAPGLRRPSHLGANRLPAFPVPGRGPRDPLAITPSTITLESNLPVALTGIEVGWKAAADPLGLLKEARRNQRNVSSDPEIEKHLAFLAQAPTPRPHFEPYDEERLPNGLLVRMRRDPEAPRVAIAVRWAPAGGLALTPGGDEDELRYSVAVDRPNLDAGLYLAAARIGLLLTAARDEPLVAISSLLGEGQRRTLEAKPFGRSWLALSDALFEQRAAGPPRLVGPDPPDGTEMTRRLTLASWTKERRPSQVSLTIVGNFDPAVARVHLRRALDAAIPGLASEGERAPSEERSRHVVRDSVPSERLMCAWLGPEPGTREAVALEVAILVLAGPKDSRFQRELLQPQYAASARGFLDPGWPESAAVLDLVPAGPVPVAKLEQRLEAILDDLRERGPSAGELAYAKAILAYRLRKRISEATEAPSTDLAEATLPSRVVESLRPGSWSRALEALDRIDASSVRDVARNVMAASRATVVVTMLDAAESSKR